jgi:hypothetical protein
MVTPEPITPSPEPGRDPLPAATRRKLSTASLVFTIFGVLMIMPPLVMLFQFDARFMGVPLEAFYIFGAWGILIAGARLFAHRLPNDTQPPAPAREPD